MRRRRIFRGLLVLSAVLVAAAVGGFAWSTYEDSADGRAMSAAGAVSRTISVDGVDRRYMVVFPRDAMDDDGERDTSDLPLVILYHGAYQTGARMMRGTDSRELADRAGAIVAYPDGLERMWGADYSAGGDAAGDLAFHDAIVDDVGERDDADVERVTVGGFSVGGMFALRVGCERSGAVTGVVDASGSMRRSMRTCEPDQPVDVTFAHARDDQVIGFNGPARLSVGRIIGGSFIDDVLPVSDTVAAWRERSGCDSQGHQCDGDVRVRLFATDSGGHGWTPSATDAVLRLVDGADGDT